LLTGCISSQNTRMPSLAYGDPRAERRTYDYHDPFADNTGPFVERPRGADHQRSFSRRAMEQSTMQPMSGTQPPSEARYQNVVHP
jgi:hypothetical protein